MEKSDTALENDALCKLVSVVIPVYNGQDYIQESIRSVLGQDYEKVDIIIVDDCSGDKTPDIVRKCMEENKDNNKMISYFRNGMNKGIGYSRNYGVKKSKGHYVMFLSHDDLMVPNTVKDFVESHGNFGGLTFSDYFIIDSKGKDMGIFKVPEFDSLQNLKVSALSNAYKNTMFINYSCIIAKRELFINIPFDDELRFGEDLDHMLRALLLFDTDIGHIKVPLIRYRMHDKNTTTKENRNIPKNNEKILKRIENGIETRNRRKVVGS